MTTKADTTMATMPGVVTEEVSARVGSRQNSPILSGGHTHITCPMSMWHVTFLKHGLGMQSEIHKPFTWW